MSYVDPNLPPFVSLHRLLGEMIVQPPLAERRRTRRSSRQPQILISWSAKKWRPFTPLKKWGTKKPKKYLGVHIDSRLPLPIPLRRLLGGALQPGMMRWGRRRWRPITLCRKRLRRLSEMDASSS